MSEIDVIGTRTATQASQTNGFSELTSEQFVKIMFAELANQDPFEPNDSQAMLNQLSSLRSIESDMTLSGKLDQLVARNEFASASGLIGSIISGTSINGEQIIDRVFSVSQTAEGPILNLYGGARVRMDRVLEVTHAISRDSSGESDV